MKRIALVLLAASLAAPAAAQYEGFFGLSAADAQALAAEAYAQNQRDEAQRAAQREKEIEKGEIVVPRNDVRCSFDAVALHMKITVKPELLRPMIWFASDIELEQFQGAVKAEYGSADGYDAVTNIFLPKSNAIYLTDAAKYYQGGRTLDDAVAREYAHYFQRNYEGAQAGADQDQLEEAVRVQEWFRAEFMAPGQ